MTDALLFTSSPRTGSLIAGKYRLEELLGTGAMGVVWRGVHVVLGHSVAVKLLRHSIASSPQTLARFEQEAKISARLGEASRHIARVHDYGVLDDGAPFVVMELLKGETLQARLSREDTLPLAQVTDIVTQLCRALATAHKGNVLHRDLKPANVFLCEEEAGQGLHVKLVDFGVAKMLEEQSFQPTHSGEIIGTPSYMSPEQLAGEGTLDARSDLWAVTAMVYRMLTGRAPFGVGNLVELGFRIVSTDPSMPTERVPALPPAIDAWMAKGLAKKPDDRFQTATELGDALAIALGEPVAERSTISKRVARSERPRAADPEPTASTRFESVERPRRALGIGSVGIVPFVIALAMALFVAGGVLAWRANVSARTRETASAEALLSAAKTAAPAPSPEPSAPAPIDSSLAISTGAAIPSASAASAPKSSPKGKPGRRPVDRAGAHPVPSAKPSLQDQAGQLWRKKDEL